MHRNKYAFITAFILTTVIFFLGYVLSYTMDFVRMEEVTTTIQDYEISSQAYLIEQDMLQTMGGDRCEMLNSRIRSLRTEIKDVGGDLTKYGIKTALNKRDFDYLKRKYFLLEIQFYTLVMNLNRECGKEYFPVLFFYKIDDEDSQQQGFVLDDLAKDYRSQVVMLSFDGDYEDEKTVQILKSQFNVTRYPTTIIDGTAVIDHLAYTSELNRSLLKVINDDGIDKYAPADFDYIFRATQTNRSAYETEVLRLVNNQSLDPFTRGDLVLVLGRLTGDNATLCLALSYYDAVNESDPMRKALAYESIASIGCGRNKKAFYLAASELWKQMGHTYHAEIDRRLALQMLLPVGAHDYWRAEEHNLSPNTSRDTIVIGDDTLIIGNDTVVSQVDRVSRDWLGLQYQDPLSGPLLTTFSERLTYNETELRADIGWHEGGRLHDMGISPVRAVGTIVQLIDGKWYAFNSDGSVRFEVPLDKVRYPTTRFLRPDCALVVDTHGVNMLVEQAEVSNASIVVGCCDHPGKIVAAKYLSDRNVSVICFTDKYLPLLFNQDARVLGSPPITNLSGTIVIGDRPLRVTSSDVILAMNVSSEVYATSYYGTPAFYFQQLHRAYPRFKPYYYTITDFGQMDSFIAAARQINATVIGIRVFSSDDYRHAKRWLSDDTNHRAVMFHSAAYPYGVLLMREFPEQTTFDDVNLE
jgi:hypothetical protein